MTLITTQLYEVLSKCGMSLFSGCGSSRITQPNRSPRLPSLSLSLNETSSSMGDRHVTISSSTSSTNLSHIVHKDRQDELPSPVSVIEIYNAEAPTTEGRSNPTYYEVTRRIDPEELHELEEKMNNLCPQDHTYFLELAQSGELSKIVGDIELDSEENLIQSSGIKDYPIHALHALRNGNLSHDDFASIVIPSASKDPNKTCIPLFTETGEIDEIAQMHIKETLSLYKGGNILSDEELHEFFQEMKKLPKLQQYFHLEVKRNDQLPIMDVREGIKTQYNGLNVFSQTSSGIMIPSVGMMQTFLKIKFKNNAARMNFVLGLSSIDDIEQNGRTNSRDAALRFPGVSLPNIADSYAALETDFLYHDFFHAIIVSLSSSETRNCIINIAKIIQNINKTDTRTQRLYESFVDMETSTHFHQITRKEIQTSTIDDFMFFSFCCLITYPLPPLQTLIAIQAIAYETWIHPNFWKEAIYLIPALLTQSILAIMYALNPFKTTPSTDMVQVLRESIEASIEELKEKEKSETDPLKKLSKTKIINELNTELDQIKSKTHKIQPTSN